MSTVWLSLLKFALSVAVTAVSKIPPDQWSKIGTVIVAWIQALENKLPADHPAIVAMNAYRAPRHKIEPPKPESGGDPWGA